MTVRKSHRFRNFLIALLAVVLVVGSGGYAYYNYLKNRIDSGLDDNKVDAIVTPTVDPHENVQRSPENILVIGSDSREGEAGARSDTMMIVHMNAERTQVTGVSVPRDLMIENMPDCNTWDSSTRQRSGEVHEFGEYTMSNAAYSIGGPACAVAAAEHVSGLQMTRYVEIDFAGFESLVNALGGVQVNICAPMIDNNLGPLFETPGVYNLDGEQALDFARARQVQGDTGSDTSRMGRQQYLIKQLFAQKASPTILMNPGKVNSLIDVFTENTITDNVQADFLEDMAWMVQQNGTDSIDMLTLPSEPWEQDSNRLKDDPAETRQMFQDIANGTYTPEQEESSAATGPTSSASEGSPETTTSAPSDDEPVPSQEVKPSAPASTTDIPCGWG